MIELTTTGGARVLINADLIECVEEGPETAILMNSGRRYTVQEDAQLVAELILGYHKRVRALALAHAEAVTSVPPAVSALKPAGEEVEMGSEIGNLPD